MKEIAYYLLRLPGAVAGISLVWMAFIPDMEPELGGIPLLRRLATLLLGIYILLPNHRFSSDRLYKVRLCSIGLAGAYFLYFGVAMISIYRNGGKDSVMVPTAIFILYNAFALPASVWLRKRAPNA